MHLAMLITSLLAVSLIHAFRLPAKLHYFLLIWRYIAPGHLLSNALPKSYGFLLYLEEFTKLQIERGNEADNSDAGYGFLCIFHVEEERNDCDVELLIPTTLVIACLSILYSVIK